MEEKVAHARSHPDQYTPPSVQANVEAMQPQQGSGKPRRKRLAKACDSCHKSKRRCDGTCPCANCDFAGKECVYTDSTGRTVPPPISKPSSDAADSRKRRTSVSPANRSAVPSSAFKRLKHATLEPTDVSYPSHTTFLEPALTKELVNLFFAHLHPYNLVFHRPTFLIDLAANRIPPHLLLTVFALAAPLSVQPKIRTNPTWYAGERFARDARIMLFDEHGDLKAPRTLEVAQSLVLLTMHDCIVRAEGQSDRHMDTALGILADLGVQSIDSDDTPDSPSSPDAEVCGPEWLAHECYRRLFYLIYIIQMLSAVVTQRPTDWGDEVLKIFLPVEEACFDLVVWTSPRSREYLFPKRPSLDGRSGTSEFGFLARVAGCYARINSLLHSNEPNPITSQEAINRTKECEKMLTDWQKSLPDHLRFNEENLHVQISTLESGGNVGGWCYCYMHALAETCVLSLQEVLELQDNIADPAKHRTRQQRALENLTIIIGSLGTRSRLSIMMGTPLIVIAKYVAADPTRSDVHLKEWCAAYESLWGVSLEQLMSVEFRKGWIPAYAPDQFTTKLPMPSSADRGRGSSSFTQITGPETPNNPGATSFSDHQARSASVTESDASSIPSTTEGSGRFRPPSPQSLRAPSLQWSNPVSPNYPPSSSQHPSLRSSGLSDLSGRLPEHYSAPRRHLSSTQTPTRRNNHDTPVGLSTSQNQAGHSASMTSDSRSSGQPWQHSEPAQPTEPVGRRVDSDGYVKPGIDAAITDRSTSPSSHQPNGQYQPHRGRSSSPSMPYDGNHLASSRTQGPHQAPDSHHTASPSSNSRRGVPAGMPWLAQDPGQQHRPRG
ncbi:hypothetical protein FRC03_008944 [Tulasnella sp. 419]|nr:hypothetical protein FRC02_000637 [Tulasnella sp. 418]KAG8958644.1 hypothetical protein FRC03_008944 [Tulasnella sp. 419]